MNNDHRLRQGVERDTRGFDRAQRRQRTVLAQARFLGTLGLMRG